MVSDLRKHRKERDSFPQFAFSLAVLFTLTQYLTETA